MRTPRNPDRGVRCIETGCEALTTHKSGRCDPHRKRACANRLCKETFEPQQRRSTITIYCPKCVKKRYETTRKRVEKEFSFYG